MQDAVRRHDAILRAAIAERGGHVFKTIGDAFCSVFEKPQNAVVAMITAQQALAAEDFSAVGGVRVRVAIHTGTAEERDGDYFGPEVNRVARLLAIGHGEQVLLTGETAALVHGALPGEMSLRDLGVYHLKDFTEPQHVHQVVAPGLAIDFPPLRSLGTLPSDLSIVDAQEFYPVAGFSGRDDELEAVRAALSGDGAIAAVHGLGGVGKSSVAREYGWRNRDAYSVIWWLNAQTEDGIIDALLRLGAMFVQGLDQLPDRRSAALRVVNSVLGGFDKPVFLVFDNLEDERLVRMWLPRTGAHALVTSRNTAWGADVTDIPMRAWDLDSAIGYLQRESDRADMSEDQARAIAQALGALPLALAHAAASLRNLRMVGVQRYLQRINDHLRKAPRGAEYPRSVFATFSAAVADAEQQAAGAAAVLSFAASFAPDAIPDELFRQPIKNYSVPELHFVIADDLRLDEALGALDRLSLLAFAQSSQSYSMHRLVQLAGQDLVSDASRAWRECAVRVADAAFPEVTFAAWPQCARLLPHVRAALDTLPSEPAFLPVGRLTTRCATYLFRRGELSTAEALHKRGLAIQEILLGPDHPDVASALNGLGNVYSVQDRDVEAEPLLKRALAIREKELGPDHPHVATVLNSLALAYRGQGRFNEAEGLHKRALAINERALGRDHRSVAVDLGNLSTLYQEQGRYDEAEALLVRMLVILQNALESGHPDFATNLGNLANLYQRQGRHLAAEGVYERSLAMLEAAVGPNHLSVSNTLDGLADLYTTTGRIEQAKAAFVRAIAIREEALGGDHARVKVLREKLEQL